MPSRTSTATPPSTGHGAPPCACAAAVGRVPFVRGVHHAVDDQLSCRCDGLAEGEVPEPLAQEFMLALLWLDLCRRSRRRSCWRWSTVPASRRRPRSEGSNG